VRCSCIEIKPLEQVGGGTHFFQDYCGGYTLAKLDVIYSNDNCFGDLGMLQELMFDIKSRDLVASRFEHCKGRLSVFLRLMWHIIEQKERLSNPTVNRSTSQDVVLITFPPCKITRLKEAIFIECLPGSFEVVDIPS
jgi:hypothetical protein